MIKALIFDVDGTLAETEEAHRQAFNDVFAAQGLDWHWDRASYADLLQVTGGKERMRFFIDARGGRPELPDTEIAALHRAKTTRYTAIVAEGGLHLRPGIERLLHEARAAKVALAIATTTSRPNVEALLQATLGKGWASYFTVIAAGDEVPRKKPAPDIYQLALRRLGLEADECLALEDSRNGLRSAMAAGLPVLVTTSAYTRQEDFTGALAVLDSLGELDAPCQMLAGPKLARGIIDRAQIETWCAAA